MFSVCWWFYVAMSPFVLTVYVIHERDLILSYLHKMSFIKTNPLPVFRIGSNESVVIHLCFSTMNTAMAFTSPVRSIPRWTPYRIFGVVVDSTSEERVHTDKCKLKDRSKRLGEEFIMWTCIIMFEPPSSVIYIHRNEINTKILQLKNSSAFWPVQRAERVIWAGRSSFQQRRNRRMNEEATHCLGSGGNEISV
jgi:hypothetical protein